MDVREGTFASRQYLTSNGPVAAVKTWQEPTPRGVSSSAATQELQYAERAYILVGQEEKCDPPDGPDGQQIAQPSAASATVEQLAALTAVPAGMGVSRGGSRKTSKVKSRPLAKDGQIIAKVFDIQGMGRPYPSIGKLLQQITVTMDNIAPAFTSSSTVPIGYAFNLPLNALSGFASYTVLFDQYRIEQIEVWLEPSVVASLQASLVTVVDVDDSNTPTSFGQVGDHQGALIGPSNMGRYHCWKPHMAVAAYSGAFTSYSNQVAGWIDCASPAVQHYGFKSWCTLTNTAIAFNVTYRAVVSFRGPGIS